MDVFSLNTIDFSNLYNLFNILKGFSIERTGDIIYSIKVNGEIQDPILGVRCPIFWQKINKYELYLEKSVVIVVHLLDKG
jgi:hypothetical protein